MKNVDISDTPPNDEIAAEFNRIVSRLTPILPTRKRVFSESIGAVLVFSGGGTYFERLEPHTQEYLTWTDRDRIRTGVALVRELTARKKAAFQGKRVPSQAMTLEDVVVFGPFLVYNGLPIQNRDIRLALTSRHSKMPTEKTIIIDEVNERDGTTHPIRHTDDQLKSFYAELRREGSPLRHITDVALVSNRVHFPRILYYTEKYSDELRAQAARELRIWAYPIRERRDAEQLFKEAELSRVMTYSAQGYLARRPSIFS